MFQILTANGYPPNWVLYDATTWECGVAAEGLKYQHLHLQEGLRLNSLLSVQPYAKDDIELTDIQRFAWDGEPKEVDDSEYREKMQKLIKEEERRLNGRE